MEFMAYFLAFVLVLTSVTSANSSSQLSTTERAGCRWNDGLETPWRSWPRQREHYQGVLTRAGLERDHLVHGPFFAPMTASSGSSRQKSYCFWGSRPLQTKGLGKVQATFLEEGDCLSLTKDVAQGLLREFPPSAAENGSMADILRTLRTRQYQVCGRRQACVPVKSAAREHHAQSGILRYLQVQRCGCAPAHADGKKKGRRRCQRMRSTQLFFEGTAFEAEVDVGVCSGRCPSTDARCSPTKTTRRVVEGPNGPLTVEVVVECGCRERCYRLPYFVSTWKRNGEALQPDLVDVGECVGTCPLSRCRDLTHGLERARCGSPDQLVEVACQPTSTSTRDVMTKGGVGRQLTVIDGCGCTSK